MVTLWNQEASMYHSVIFNLKQILGKVDKEKTFKCNTPHSWKKVVIGNLIPPSVGNDSTTLYY